MKNLKIFIGIFLILIYTNIFPDGYIQIHNKTSYPAEIIYNFGTKDQSRKVNEYKNSPILSTHRGFLRSSSGHINKLNIKLYSKNKNKLFDSRLMDNLNIEVNPNKITHIYIVYISGSTKNPKLRIACMQEGKIIRQPYFEKDSTNIKADCDNALKTEMRPIISYIPKKLANDRAIFLIQNKSGLSLKVKTSSFSFYEDYANIKNIYLYPGNYYYQTLDEIFEAKELTIEEIDGKRKETIKKINIPTGMVTTVNITKVGVNDLKTEITRSPRRE